jgi:hypothetical protein
MENLNRKIGARDVEKNRWFKNSVTTRTKGLVTGTPVYRFRARTENYPES